MILCNNQRMSVSSKYSNGVISGVLEYVCKSLYIKATLKINRDDINKITFVNC